MTELCTDPWHDDENAPYLTYRISYGGASAIGYQCITCGFRTVEITDAGGVDITDSLIVPLTS